MNCQVGWVRYPAPQKSDSNQATEYFVHAAAAKCAIRLVCHFASFVVNHTSISPLIPMDFGAHSNLIRILAAKRRGRKTRLALFVADGRLVSSLLYENASSLKQGSFPLNSTIQ
jgi:hypothetical protein